MKTGTIIESTSVTDDGDVEVLELELKGVGVNSVYKPPVDAFRVRTLRTSKTQVVIGDFNSHGINWGYNESNLDGDAEEAWAEASQPVVALWKGGPLCKLNGGALFFTHYFNMFYLHLQLSATMHFVNNETRRPMQLQP